MRTWITARAGLGALAAAGYALWRAFERRKADSGVTWDPQPFPYPPEPHTEAPTAADTPAVGHRPPRRGWVDADDGACPASHPVKAKLASGIFHVPGGANYARTRADRCYALAAEAAESRRPAPRASARARASARRAPSGRGSERERGEPRARASAAPQVPCGAARRGRAARQRSCRERRTNRARSPGRRRCRPAPATDRRRRRAPVWRSTAPSARRRPWGRGPRSSSLMLMPPSSRGSCRRSPDHARRVVVAHHEHVARRREVDDVVVDGDDARRVLLAVERARDVGCCARRCCPRSSTRFT